MQREIKNEIVKACGGASGWGSGCCRQFTVPLACVSNTDLWKAGTSRTRKLLLFCLSREVPAVYTVVFAYVIITGAVSSRPVLLWRFLSDWLQRSLADSVYPETILPLEESFNSFLETNDVVLTFALCRNRSLCCIEWMGIPWLWGLVFLVVTAPQNRKRSISIFQNTTRCYF